MLYYAQYYLVLHTGSPCKMYGVIGVILKCEYKRHPFPLGSGGFFNRDAPCIPVVLLSAPIGHVGLDSTIPTSRYEHSYVWKHCRGPRPGSSSPSRLRMSVLHGVSTLPARVMECSSRSLFVQRLTCAFCVGRNA